VGRGLVFIGSIAKHMDMWAYCQVLFRFHSRKSYFFFWKNQKKLIDHFFIAGPNWSQFFIASFISSREQFDVKHIISKYYLYIWLELQVFELFLKTKLFSLESITQPLTSRMNFWEQDAYNPSLPKGHRNH